jgi:hypothetical protein
MSFFPYNSRLGQQMQGDPGARNILRSAIAHLHLTTAQAATADTDAVHAAVTDTGVQQVITTGITNPPFPRNITATAGGTAGDIKAITVTIAGTNEAGAAITEVLPAFTVNTAGTVAGTKAFKTVTSITIPAHDGLGATTEIGFGDLIGLPHMLTGNTVLFAALDGVREGTAPTVVADADEIEKNTCDLNSALNGTVVDVWYVVP